MERDDKNFYDILEAKIYSAEKKDLEKQTSTIVHRIDELVVRDKVKLNIVGAEALLLKGDQGSRGERGDNGSDGKDGVNGKDGAPGKDGIDGVDGISIDGLPGAAGAPGRDGKDGSPDLPIDIKKKLETLKNDDRLDVSAVKGIENIQPDLSFLPRSLGALYDTSIIGPTNGQALVYDAPLNKWKPSTVVAAIDIGDTVVGGTEGSVLFVGPGPVLAQDNANFFWDDTNNTLISGGTTNIPTIGSAIRFLAESNTSGTANIGMWQASADGTASTIFGFKTRGTLASPTNALLGDNLLTVVGSTLGSGGAVIATNLPAAMQFYLEGSPGAAYAPGAIRFLTTDATTQVISPRLVIDSVGQTELLATDVSSSSSIFALFVNGQYTLTGDNTSVSGFSFTGTVVQNAANPFVAVNLFSSAYTLKNPTATARSLGIATNFISQPTIQADTQTVTLTANAGFISQATLSKVGAGVLTVTQHNDFWCGEIQAIPTGTTLTTRRGFYYENTTAGFAGTFTTQYGIHIEALTSAGTNYAIKTDGAGLVQFGDQVTMFDKTSGIGAIFATTTLATSNKTFTFPNLSGQFGLFSGSRLLSVGTATPSSPATGDLWVDTN